MKSLSNRDSDLIDEIIGQAKSNQGKRNDLTSTSVDVEVKTGRTITQAHIKRFKPC